MIQESSLFAEWKGVSLSDNLHIKFWYSQPYCPKSFGNSECMGLEMGLEMLVQFVFWCSNVSWHAWIRKILSEGGSNLRLFFLSLWGEEGSKYHYKGAIMGPPAKRHFYGVSLAGPWWRNINCWLGSFVNFQGIGTSIAKKSYIFVIFQGEVLTPCPPLWICACLASMLRVADQNITVQETACTGYHICHAHTCYMSDLINNECVLCNSLSWRVHIN